MSSAAPGAAPAQRKCFIVLPALMPNGGVREALRLAADLPAAGACDAPAIVSLWAGPDSARVLEEMGPGARAQTLSAWPPRLAHALWQWPVLAWRFARGYGAALGRKNAGAPEPVLLLTHYTTLPLAFMAQPASRWFLVQDLEWLFVKPAWAQKVLRHAIVFMLRRGNVLTTNSYLQQALGTEGVRVRAVVDTWADKRFGLDVPPGAAQRDVDVVMVLRRGAHKALAAYEEAIENLSAMPGAGARPVRVALVTPDTQLADAFRGRVQECLLQPDLPAMRALYARSKCFLHLSEHEGFGLPPLEAMGAGCVPVCRDSGGVRTYLQGALASQLLPPRAPVAMACDQVRQLLEGGDNQWHRLSRLAHGAFMQGLVNPLQRQRVLSSLWP